MKRKSAQKVFVAHYANHVDCYKRGESWSEIIGVFVNKQDAISDCLLYFGGLLENLANENGEFKSEDLLLQKFADHKKLSEEEETYVFKQLCVLQNEQRGEFSIQASGKYISIDEVELEVKKIKKNKLKPKEFFQFKKK